MLDGAVPNPMALASLTLLVTWEFWNELNARVFRNKHAPTLVVLEKIKRKLACGFLWDLGVWVK